MGEMENLNEGDEFAAGKKGKESEIMLTIY